MRPASVSLVRGTQRHLLPFFCEPRNVLLFFCHLLWKWQFAIFNFTLLAVLSLPIVLQHNKPVTSLYYYHQWHHSTTPTIIIPTYPPQRRCALRRVLFCTTPLRCAVFSFFLFSRWLAWPAQSPEIFFRSLRQTASLFVTTSESIEPIRVESSHFPKFFFEWTSKRVESSWVELSPFPKVFFEWASKQASCLY
jgi:hypothetical protein